MNIGDKVKFTFAKKEMEGTVQKIFPKNRLSQGRFSQRKREDCRTKNQRCKVKTIVVESWGRWVIGSIKLNRLDDATTQ